MTYEHEMHIRRVSSVSSQIANLGLFGVVPIREMARRGAPQTSKDAAINISGGLKEIQRKVLTAYETHGPMGANVAENLPQFRDAYAPSTIRKRISELAQRGWLRDTGQRDRGCTVYEASSANTGPTNPPLRAA